MAVTRTAVGEHLARRVVATSWRGLPPRTSRKWSAILPTSRTRRATTRAVVDRSSRARLTQSAGAGIGRPGALSRSDRPQGTPRQEMSGKGMQGRGCRAGTAEQEEPGRGCGAGRARLVAGQGMPRRSCRQGSTRRGCCAGSAAQGEPDWDCRAGRAAQGVRRREGSAGRAAQEQRRRKCRAGRAAQEEQRRESRTGSAARVLRGKGCAERAAQGKSRRGVGRRVLGDVVGRERAAGLPGWEAAQAGAGAGAVGQG